MPRGTRHTLTVILSWDDCHHMHRLDLSGGGGWFVDLPGRARHLLGREITVEGVRSGFNMLDVARVVAADGAPAVGGGRSWLAAARDEAGSVWPGARADGRGGGSNRRK